MTEEAPKGGGNSWSSMARGDEIVLYPPSISLYDVAGVNPRARSEALSHSIAW